MYRKVQELELAQLYLNDKQFRADIRMTSALFFVPIEDTIQAFEALANQAGNEEQAVDYFKSN